MAYRTQDNKAADSLQPPQSLDAEQAVLGSILKDQDATSRAVEVLDSPEHFYYPKHQMIYRAILELYEKAEPCDITTIANILSREGTLDKIGGRVYLVELVESIASTANITTHCNIVLEKSVLRRLIQTSNEIIRSCYAHEQPVDDLLDAAESNIFFISESRLRKGFTSIKDLMPSTFEQIENLQTGHSDLVGLKSGFEQIDVLTNGLHRGELVIVAGRPSMGKSALVMNMAEYVAVEHKKGVGVFSIEMSSESLALRLLCSRAKVSQQKLRAGKLRNEEWSRLSSFGGALSEAPIFIDDSPTLTALEMRAKARRLKAQYNVELLILDYIQMMHASGRHENRQQEIAAISRSMKILAKELDIPVIACSQLSRMVEQRGGEKRPQLSDLRESGAIEQDADVVMFVYRPEHYLSHLEKTDPKYIEVEGKAEIIVAKQRNGPTGVANLTFVKDFARFENQAAGYRDLPPGVEPVDGQGITPF
ncbi:MAG TPA: replicative DNA helicase [candidate division Zixibacteria bacterium]|nr:replicative DNA helicase [candidate division Zixibacteria bacterium]